MTTPTTGKDGLPILAFASAAEWEAWLDEHHATAAGVWLRLARKGSGMESVSRSAALDAALCYGWIDSQAASLDEHFWLQRFTPRTATSKWSKVNRQKVEQLIEAGRMKPAGLAEIERAKGDGRWERAYDSPSTATVPDDLLEALDGNPRARAFFDTLDGRNRYAILHRIQTAKRAETRARRIEKFVAMLDAGETIY